MTEHRYAEIMRVWNAAVRRSRDPYGPDTHDVVMAVYDAMPDVAPREIVAALRWSADRAYREVEDTYRLADVLERGIVFD